MLLPVDGGSQVEQAASAGHLAFVALAEAGTLDPVTAGEHESLFAEWAWPVSYKKIGRASCRERVWYLV